MFFEKEFISFNLLDVLYLNQNNVNIKNEGRNFNAVSFRLRSDATLKTEFGEYHMRENYVALFPARVDYRRIANNDELMVVHFDSTDYHTENIEFFEAQSPERLKKLFENSKVAFCKLVYTANASTLFFAGNAKGVLAAYQKVSQVVVPQVVVEPLVQQVVLIVVLDPYN